MKLKWARANQNGRLDAAPSSWLASPQWEQGTEEK